MCKFKGKQWFLSSLLTMLIITFLGFGTPAQSQEKYPTKAIDIIISMSPGGSTDMIPRLTASYLSKKWGVPVNALNKAGGNSVPAVTELYNSPPNGYTVLADIQPCSSMMELGTENLPFKVMDRTFIAMITRGGMVFFVPFNSPYKTIEDVIAAAKKDPDNFTWTSLGGFGGPDIAVRQLFKATGVDISRTKPVLCKGGSDAATLTAAGNVKLGCSTPIAASGVAKAGLVRMLGITAERTPEFPDLRTMAELGYPTVNLAFWIGFSGPPKVPSYIVDIWNKALKDVLKDPEYISRLKKVGYTIYYLNPPEMKKYIMNETEEGRVLYGLTKK
jgi:tripartite-type tricarboxylate transporter receptor subunit TctC